MARSLSHEAKELILSADNGKEPRFFSKKQSNAVYVGNASFFYAIKRNSSYQVRMT